MWRRASTSLLLLASACAANPPPDPRSGDVEVVEVAPSKRPGKTAVAAGCGVLDLELGRRAFDRAQSFIALMTNDEHPTQEDWDRGMADLEEAAQNGHLEAQTRFGTYLLGSLFMDHDPAEGDQPGYVKALTYLRIAALRGDATALGVADTLADPDPSVGINPDHPLVMVPKAVFDQAVAAAATWLECAPRLKPR